MNRISPNVCVVPARMGLVIYHDDLLVSCEKYAQAICRIISAEPKHGANAMWVLFPILPDTETAVSF